MVTYTGSELKNSGSVHLSYLNTWVPKLVSAAPYGPMEELQGTPQQNTYFQAFNYSFIFFREPLSVKALMWRTVSNSGLFKLHQKTIS